MEEPLRDKLFVLAALQQIDLDVAALQKTADSFPKDMATLEKALQEVRAEIEGERNKLAQLEKERTNLEETLGDDRDRVRKWEGRLTEQRSTREYSALAREIDIAKKGQQTMVEDLAELARQAAMQREALRAREQAFTAKEADLGAHLAQLRVQLKEVEAKMAAVEGSRGSRASAVDRELLRRYESIRRKRMPALVPITASGTCSGCQMNLRPQLYNLLVASRSVDTCPSCSRMIYAAEVLPEVAKAEAN